MFCQLWCHAGRPQVVGGADGFCWPTNNQRLRGVPPIWNEKNQNHYQRGCFCDNACGHLMLLFFALHQQNFESESREPPNRTSPVIWNRLAGLSNQTMHLHAGLQNYPRENRRLAGDVFPATKDLGQLWEPLGMFTEVWPTGGGQIPCSPWTTLCWSSSLPSTQRSMLWKTIEPWDLAKTDGRLAISTETSERRDLTRKDGDAQWTWIY